MTVVNVIALDGPVASGKGTIAAKVADILEMEYLDSGALYRLTALYAQEKNIAWDDEQQLAKLAVELPVSFSVAKTFLEQRDVTDAIRQESIGMGASAVAKLPQVRLALLERQRAFLGEKGLVADGRDMASVVFPSAILKIFLTASADERARRRALQLGYELNGAEYQKILSDIEARDEADRNRAVAPLKQDPDAYLLDTTNLNVDETVQKVLDWYRQS